MSNHRKTIETHHQQWSHHPNAGCTCGEKYDHKTREQDHTTHLYAVHEQLIRAQVAQEIRDHWDACGVLINSHNAARIAFDNIAHQIAEEEQQ